MAAEAARVPVRTLQCRGRWPAEGAAGNCGVVSIWPALQEASGRL